MNTNTHARLSPSSASRWLSCTASIDAIEEANIEDVSSDAAIEGTTAHELAEHCLTTGDDPLDMTEDYPDEEMRQNIADYIDYISAYNFDGMEVEVKLPLFYALNDYGTADVVGVRGKVLYVVDLKYGQQVRVEVRDNPQLLIYAISALKMQRNIDYVVTVIYQPRMNNIASWVYSIEELAAHEEEISKRARETKESPEFAPSEKACVYCPAKPTCEALSEHVEEVVGNAFEDLDDPARILNERLSLILSNKKLITDWLKAVEVRAVQQIQGGATVPGYKLVKGRGRKVWGNTQKLESILQEEAYEKVVLSPAKFIKLAKKNKLRKDLTDEIKEFIIIHTGNEIIVPVTDKREEVEILKFKALEEHG